jgi:hypothetical protein
MFQNNGQAIGITVGQHGVPDPLMNFKYLEPRNTLTTRKGRDDLKQKITRRINKHGRQFQSKFLIGFFRVVSVFRGLNLPELPSD